MTRPPDFIELLEDYLDEFEGDTPMPDATRDAIRDQLPSIHQRRARLPGWRFSEMRATGRFALAGPAILAVALLGIQFLAPGGGTGGRGGPGEAAVRALASLPPGPLQAGSYVIDAGLPVRIAFEIPEGWSKAEMGTDHAAVTRHPDGNPDRPPTGVSLGFFIVANLFSDPCALEGSMIDPPVGPTGDDLVAAFRDVPAYEVSAAIPASVDGYLGQRIDLDLKLYMCPFRQAQLWQTPTGSVRTLAGEEERSTLWIVDVGGERLVVDATSYPGTTQERLDELRAVVDSIRIEPARKLP